MNPAGVVRRRMPGTGEEMPATPGVRVGPSLNHIGNRRFSASTFHGLTRHPNYGSRETVRRDQQMVPCRSDLAVGSGADRLLWLREHAWNADFFRWPRPGSSRPCGAIAPSGSPSLAGRTRGMLRGDSPGPTAHVRISTWLAVRALRVTRDLLASRAQLVPSNAGQRARHLLPVPSASLFPAYPGDPAVGRRAIAVHKGTAATWWRSIPPFAGRTLVRPLLGLTTAEASRLATRQEGRARTLARR